MLYTIAITNLCVCVCVCNLHLLVILTPRHARFLPETHLPSPIIRYLLLLLLLYSILVRPGDEEYSRLNKIKEIKKEGL